MLNYIWAGMLLVGILYALFTGNMEAVSNACLEYAESAVTLCITMAGAMALWVGLMEIAGQAGLIEKFTNKLQPFITFLFPDVPKDHPARGYIATNLVANILGLGWACTPAGLKAMEELAKLEEERGTPGYEAADRGRKAKYGSGISDGLGGAEGDKRKGRLKKGERAASDAMCGFLILNISSLQLIPVNMIVYRTKYGSLNPSGIILPAILATCCSTLAGIVYIKMRYGRKSGC